MADLSVDRRRTRLKEPSEVELSPREREIARLVSDGYTNGDAAEALGISPWTVATHLRRVFGKLNVRSRAQMVARLFDADLL